MAHGIARVQKGINTKVLETFQPAQGIKKATALSVLPKRKKLVARGSGYKPYPTKTVLLPTHQVIPSFPAA